MMIAENVMLMELTPRYDSADSFYGKAKIVTEGQVLKLYSYDTHVATITQEGLYGKGKAEVITIPSKNTLRHVKEFLKQGNFRAETKGQILEDYTKK